jgi:poly-gamma-glutamate synthesis protein (capsule biosynthesis protein)
VIKWKLIPIIFFLALAGVAGLVLTRVQNKPTYQKNKGMEILQTMTVPPQFDDKSLFLTAIKISTTTPGTNTVTGITVPHHLLAVDLMANAFKFASASRPDQILLVSPDHFNLGQTDISVSQSDFSTVFGTIGTDKQAAQSLLKLPFVGIQDFFYREHGLGAELPFIKYYFPEAKIIALTFKESTPKAELEQTVEKLKKILSKNSLVVQSTDFSHYLLPENAFIRDEQTIAVLKNGNPEQLFSLNQPDNLDSIACQYVQTRLQNEFFSSKLQILAHKNSQNYTQEKLTSTTSYIVQAYQMVK